MLLVGTCTHPRELLSQPQHTQTHTHTHVRSLLILSVHAREGLSVPTCASCCPRPVSPVHSVVSTSPSSTGGTAGGAEARAGLGVVSTGSRPCALRTRLRSAVREPCSSDIPSTCTHTHTHTYTHTYSRSHAHLDAIYRHGFRSPCACCTMCMCCAPR